MREGRAIWRRGPAGAKQRGSRGAEHPENREQYTIRYAPYKNAKKTRVRQRKHHPPIERKVTSPSAGARVQPHITQTLKTSKNFFYLCIMSVWELEIQSRFRIGPAVGFSIYLSDTEYDYSEFILFLLFISIHFKWEEPWTD